jgi:hypothetical protein
MMTVPVLVVSAAAPATAASVLAMSGAVLSLTGCVLKVMAAADGAAGLVAGAAAGVVRVSVLSASGADWIGERRQHKTGAASFPVAPVCLNLGGDYFFAAS